MRRLDIPLREVDQETIYHDCVDNMHEENRARALSYLADVVSSSVIYERYVPRDIEHFPQCAVGEEEAKFLKNTVYDKKFVEGDGRKYYESILLNAQGRCPMCGCGAVSTLDHFLPKKVYPLLSVTPANLIPACYHCNYKKSYTTSMDYYSIPFNPYFDDMEDEWLECDFTVCNDKTIKVEYKNGYDKSVNERLWNKYETHFRVFDLKGQYYVKAVDEIESRKSRYQNLLRKCGTESVKEDLIECKDSCEKIDINSWNSALYRELVRKADVFCNWLLQ